MWAEEEVLLLIHGGRTDATDWQNVLAALARHYHLVIADGMVYPFDARDLWWLLDHLGVSRVAIVAHSAGTLVGKEMYFMRPDRVWAFVNVDSHQLGGRSDGHELPNQHSAHLTSRPCTRKTTRDSPGWKKAGSVTIPQRSM